MLFRAEQNTRLILDLCFKYEEEQERVVIYVYVCMYLYFILYKI